MEVLQPLMLLAKPESLLNPEAKPEIANGSAIAEKASTDETGTGETREKQTSENKTGDAPALKPLSGAAKGLLYQLYEGLGTMPRRLLADQIKELSEADKPILARAGIRMGIENLFLPAMLKPAPIALRVLLFSLYHENFPLCGAPPEGRVSFSLDEEAGEKMPEDRYWLATGYCRLGSRIMRVDMVERVAALVRAAAREGQFEISEEMLSLAGVGREEMALIVSGLGCKQVSERPSDDPEKPSIAIFERQKRKSAKPQQGQKPHPDKARTAKASKGARRRSNGNTNNSQTRASSPSRQNNAKQPDPNSPFAVLAALKKG
jgi:ATP-dependent RNA helicase SUPV3L1/SUV3